MVARVPLSPTKPRITLRDIAKRLKISHTTVSRALRNDMRISESMREQVRIAAEEMGHRPDPMLSALAHYRHAKLTKTISAELAWINAWQDPTRLRQLKEFDQYWRGATEEAERCGFRLDEFIINRQMPPQRLQQILQARNIRGILIPPHGGIKLDWDGFHWEEFCLVRFGYSVDYPHAHVVSSDQLTDGLIAYENIFKKGYRRIGLVTSFKSTTRFGAGFLFSQTKWSPEAKLPTLVLEQERGEDDRTLLKKWLKAHTPDAILTDVCETRALLEEAGWPAPQRIGLAALSVLDGNADAGINQNSYEIGRAAVQLLISLINHNESGIPKICREVLIEGTWVDGSTLPAKAPSSKRVA